MVLLEAAMKKQGWNKKVFLIDGFPRNKENVTCFGEVLGEKVDLLGSLFFDLDNETMRERCLGRGEGRADDNEQTIMKRLNTYQNDTVPIIEEMKATSPDMVNRIDAKQTKEEVFACACE